MPGLSVIPGFTVIGVAHECGSHHHGIGNCVAHIVLICVGIGVVASINCPLIKSEAPDPNIVIVSIVIVLLSVIGCIRYSFEPICAK